MEENVQLFFTVKSVGDSAKYVLNVVFQLPSAVSQHKKRSLTWPGASTF